MTATERDHLREDRHALMLTHIDATLAEFTVWRAQYDLWAKGH